MVDNFFQVRLHLFRVILSVVHDFLCYNANRPCEAHQPGVLFTYSRLSYNGREIGLTRLLMDYPCPAAKQSAILPL